MAGMRTRAPVFRHFDVCIVAIVGCSAPEPAARVVPPPAPVSPQAWALIGRASPSGLDVPPLTVSAPFPAECAWCFVEQWGDGRRTLNVVRGPDAVTVGAEKGVNRWDTLSPQLRLCIGDVFALPPAGDPGGRRTFDGSEWTLHLSGANACHLGGTLVLDATSERAEWRGLTVDGLSWDAGHDAFKAYALVLAGKTLNRDPNAR